MLVGFDPSEATPLLDLHIKRAVRRAGAKLLIVNPRRIELAKYPGAYLPVLPGNEAVAVGRAGDGGAGGQGRESAKSANQQTCKSQTRRARQPTNAIRSTQYAPTVDLLTAAKSPLFIYGPDAARGERGRLAVTALSNLAIQLGFGDRLAYVGAEG